jgi:hypothetical protein
MLRISLCSLLLVLSSGAADAFSLAKRKPHDILHQMGFAMGTAKCTNLSFNWLAHDLVFDWAEAKLGEDINLERNKAPTIAGAEAADALIKRGLPGYCAELWKRFGDTGTQIPGLLVRK